jgi:hypothetical protein
VQYRPITFSCLRSNSCRPARSLSLCRLSYPTNTTPWTLIRKRIIPTEQPTLVGEI